MVRMLTRMEVAPMGLAGCSCGIFYKQYCSSGAVADRISARMIVSSTMSPSLRDLVVSGVDCFADQPPLPFGP